MKLLILFALSSFLLACRPNRLTLYPGVGMEGCSLGMLESEVSKKSKARLEAHFLFDAANELFMIVDIKSDDLVVDGYGVGVGDFIEKISGWEAGKVSASVEAQAKIDMGGENVVSFDGVAFSIDDSNKITSISIFSKKRDDP
jgi:hypothetical protein